jgi:hypothetical protein
MTCQAANQTLNPHQILLDKVDRGLSTLEKQAALILPFVTDFRTQGTAFDPNNLSSTSAVNAALNAFTKEAICASKTDLAPIDDFTEDCLNDILALVKKYLNDLLGNVEDGIDLIQDILNLPENALMKLLQKLWRLCNDIYNLVAGLDRKLQCVVVNDKLGVYTAQVVALQTRIDTVIDDLYLADDGSFDSDRLMTGFNAGLQQNLNLYKSRSTALQQEITDDVNDVISVTTTNPRNKY